mmetsp:Transcript_37660/g.81648  ORF Transcript_37660/g.81648 Transcript_37660/m.81648 type:complete len:139 (-) Transcript_37660:371-787(-)
MYNLQPAAASSETVVAVAIESAAEAPRRGRELTQAEEVMASRSQRRQQNDGGWGFAFWRLQDHPCGSFKQGHDIFTGHNGSFYIGRRADGLANADGLLGFHVSYWRLADCANQNQRHTRGVSLKLRKPVSFDLIERLG